MTTNPRSTAPSAHANPAQYTNTLNYTTTTTTYPTATISSLRPLSAASSSGRETPPARRSIETDEARLERILERYRVNTRELGEATERAKRGTGEKFAVTGSPRRRRRSGNLFGEDATATATGMGMEDRGVGGRGRERDMNTFAHVYTQENPTATVTATATATGTTAALDRDFRAREAALQRVERKLGGKSRELEASRERRRARLRGERIVQEAGNEEVPPVVVAQKEEEMPQTSRTDAVMGGRRKFGTGAGNGRPDVSTRVAAGEKTPSLPELRRDPPARLGRRTKRFGSFGRENGLEQLKAELREPVLVDLDAENGGGLPRKRRSMERQPYEAGHVEENFEDRLEEEPMPARTLFGGRYARRKRSDEFTAMQAPQEPEPQAEPEPMVEAQPSEDEQSDADEWESAVEQPKLDKGKGRMIDFEPEPERPSTPTLTLSEHARKILAEANEPPMEMTNVPPLPPPKVPLSPPRGTKRENETPSTPIQEYTQAHTQTNTISGTIEIPIPDTPVVVLRNSKRTAAKLASRKKREEEEGGGAWESWERLARRAAGGGTSGESEEEGKRKEEGEGKKEAEEEKLDVGGVRGEKVKAVQEEVKWQEKEKKGLWDALGALAGKAKPVQNVEPKISAPSSTGSLLTPPPEEQLEPHLPQSEPQQAIPPPQPSSQPAPTEPTPRDPTLTALELAISETAHELSAPPTPQKDLAAFAKRLSERLVLVRDDIRGASRGIEEVERKLERAEMEEKGKEKERECCACGAHGAGGGVPAQTQVQVQVSLKDLGVWMLLREAGRAGLDAVWWRRSLAYKVVVATLLAVFTFCALEMAIFISSLPSSYTNSAHGVGVRPVPGFGAGIITLLCGQKAGEWVKGWDLGEWVLGVGNVWLER